MATFDFKRTALRATQRNFALLAGELMSFGHLRAALKDNIREGIGEIQLHTIDNVLKNWTDRVGYCMHASRGSHLKEIIFRY